MKRPILIYLFAVILASTAAAINFPWLLLIPATALTYLVLRKKIKAGTVFLCLLFIALTWLHADMVLRHTTSVDRFDKKDITITAQAVGYPQYSDGRSRAVFKILSIEELPLYRDGDKILLSVYSDSRVELIPGAIYKITGRLKVPEHETNPGGFDYHFYLKTQNLHLTMWTTPEDFLLTDTASLPFFYDKLLALRTYCIDIVDHYLPKEEASVLSSVIFGSNDISGDTLKVFRDIGITHILAVSGLNTGILYVFLSFILNRLRAGRKTRFYLLTLTLLFYLLLTGIGISMLRATLMMWFICLSDYIGKKGDHLNFLCIAAFLMLVVNPLTLFNVSFQMSFSAVLVIVLFAPVVEHKLASIKIQWLRKTFSFVLMCLIIQIAMAPITAYYFNSFSFVGFIANIFIIPVTSVILPSALIGVLFSFIPAVSEALIGFSAVFVKYILWMSDVFAAIPYACIYVRSTKWYDLVLVYSSLLSYFGYIDLRKKSGKIVLSASLVCFMLFTGLSYIPPLYSSVNFIDVGFGDCILIRTNTGNTVLIDGGGYLSSDTANYDILPYMDYYNIRKIDAVIATHSDSDHVGGLIGLFGKIKIGAVYANDDGERLYSKLIEAADNYHVNVLGAKKGDIINAGGLVLSVLNPADMDSGLSDNDLSIVLKAAIDGKDFLFTGDAGKTPLDTIREEYDLTGIDVIKAHHHGSYFLSLKELYDECALQYAVICVGPNGYHLPSQKYISMLEESQIPYYTTEQYGCITMTIKNGEILTKTYLHCEQTE